MTHKHVNRKSFIAPTQAISKRIKSVFCHLTIAGLLGIASLAAQGQTQVLDTVVAVVDDDVVMASELNQRLQQIISTNDPAKLPPEAELKEQVLERLIIERLQLQMADRAGIKISNEELDQAMAQMRASRQLTDEQFAAKLAADGLSMNQLREQIRREMLINQVQQGRVNRRIRVTEQDIDNFLKSPEGQYWLSPDYHLSHLLVAVGETAPENVVADAKAKAEALYNKLQQGADFKALAQKNSNGQNAAEGGELGWRKKAQLPSQFAEALSGLNAGDITKPFRSPAGFHILKVEEKRGGESTIIQQAKVRHILIKPSEILDDEAARQKLNDIRDRIIAGEADFAEMAKEYSEDIGSMLAGGDLGWSLPGKFVPVFEETINKTPIGEISKPFRSQFGWHILEVEERREKDMTETVIQNQAANLIRKQRFDSELQDWISEIRSQAYVETRLK